MQMNRVFVKYAVATLFSAGMLVGGASPALAAPAESTPVASPSIVVPSSGSGALLAPLLCKLLGGVYSGSNETTPATCN
ncbi:hypothetical protein ACIRRA_32165 [Nocardia sp. NPDC101769]|uniref:hypothetical protein n=1 Tax=Nocardia sp. NPDC101769 TaxID=3364333 RepID=UPI0037F685C2